METEVSKSQFKAKALELLREVERTGESLIVTDHGVPTIEVRRYHPREVDPLERLKGSVLAYEAPTEPVAEDDWEAA
jgi:prevent-host-death family protein